MKIKLIFDDGTETEISERGLEELAKTLNEEKVTLDPWGKYPYSYSDGRRLHTTPLLREVGNTEWYTGR
jgi:hypothetical protein